jgi:3-hydroxyisobutyrate dehydrogenase-like beta-hydroxyacid dehydrogenase
VVGGRFAFGAALSILDKDVRLGIAEAGALGVPMWTLEQMARLWRLAAIEGYGAADLTVLARLVEGWSGVPIRRGGAG